MTFFVFSLNQIPNSPIVDFISYCKDKKIDPVLFQAAENERFKEWEQIFDKTGPISFTQQKLFMINNIRRKYKLEKQVETIENKPIIEDQETKPKINMKPLGFKPKY